jgi:hypothetical protein
VRHVRSALTSFLLAVLVAVAVAGCGRIAFGPPSAEAGWLVFSGDSGGDGGIFDATAVRIRFAGH